MIKNFLSVAFSPDGKILASGSNDETIKLWDVETGDCIRVLKGPEDWVRSVAFSPDGKILASESKDYTICLWDVETGDCIRVLKGHEGEILSVAFSPDGKILASGSKDETIRLWDVETGDCIRVLKEHEDSVRSVAFSPDGKILASESKDKTIRLRDKVLGLLVILIFVVILLPTKLGNREAERLPEVFKTKTKVLKGIPRLALSVSISDENENNLFEGREKVKISVKAQNIGKGAAHDVKLVIKGAKTLGIPELLTIGTIEPSSSVEKTYTYRLPDKIEGRHKISFVLRSSGGFMSNQKEFIVVAKNYEPPNIIFDYALKDANGNMKFEPGEEGILYIVLKNTGGNAKRVYVSVELPSYVKIIQGKTEHLIPNLLHGETKKIGIDIVVPHAYAMKHKDIPISVKVKAEKFSKEKTFLLALGQYIQPPEELVLKPKVQRPEITYIASSDVDRKIKEMKQTQKRTDALALVIGIGSYKNLPTSIYSDYDAILMQGLFEKAYGIPVKSLINQDATFAEIKNTVEMLSADAREKEVYVYYSGHGFPKEQSPAIVPYDSPQSLRPEYLISLSWIAEEFKKAGAKKVIVLADACYSGYNREGKNLVSEARPAFLQFKKFIVGDIFSAATSNDGKSYSDKNLRHGIFTYYVAKGLLEGDMDRDGAIEVSELKNYLDEARRHAKRLGYSDQKPVLWPEEKNMIVVRK